MALIDLWRRDKAQLADKNIQQIIAFAGDGRLADGSAASAELRAYLQMIPSELLSKYAEQCLQEAFTDSGFALQDVVNEIGCRLDFKVTHGRYRGTSSQPGHDGVWADGDKHDIVVEVKTTDAFRVHLDTIAGYRQMLAKTGDIDLEASSLLVVVGRQDTGDLEAQIRGSRHAWDMRVISIGALLRMLNLKEALEDPEVLHRIHEILIPMEFTRLDPIVEIAFAAVEDVKLGPDSEEGDDTDGEPSEKKFTPVAFHAQCVARIEKKLNETLVKQSRASFASADGSVRVVCAVSRFHERVKRFWFAFHPHQAKFLRGAKKSFVAFGCGDAKTLFLIPFADFEPWLGSFNKTEREERFYWHVKIKRRTKGYAMMGRAGTSDFDISAYEL